MAFGSSEKKHSLFLSKKQKKKHGSPFSPAACLVGVVSGAGGACPVGPSPADVRIIASARRRLPRRRPAGARCCRGRGWHGDG
jgi:hypothetical protein